MNYTIRTSHEVLIAVPAPVWRAQQRSREASHDYKQQLAMARGTAHTLGHQTMFDDVHNIYVEVAKFDDLSAAQIYVARAKVYIDGLTAIHKESANA